MNNRVFTFDTNDDISKKVIDFVNSGLDIDKGLCAGVTRILSKTKDQSGLDEWRDRIGHDEADRILNESRDIGTSLDNLILSYYSNLNFKDDDNKEELGYTLFKQLKMPLRRLTPIAMQLKIWSLKYKMMGYIDCLGYFDGELSLIDFKNSLKKKTPEYYHDYLLQCTLYCVMMKILLDIEVKQIVLLIGVRSDVSPQIIKARTKDYVKEAMDRVNIFNSTPTI